MNEIIPIIERLGSLGILVLMVWRAPAIISAIKDLLSSVSDKISELQNHTLDIYINQQETERNLVAQRFETLEKGIEKMGMALDSSMKVQTEILHQQQHILDRLDRLENK